MTDKIQNAHSYISGEKVGLIFMDFVSEFLDIYPRQTFEGMCAVGPLQSLIGHAIKKGHLRVGDDMPTNVSDKTSALIVENFKLKVERDGAIAIIKILQEEIDARDAREVK